MFEFKLQVGCLLIVLYIVVVYVKQTLSKSIPCNWIFDMLLTFAPWAIIFDGATAWTVNHTDLVPAWLNLLLHGAFFVSMALVMMFLSLYMISQTVGIRNARTTIVYMLPGFATIAGSLVFLNQLYFVHGKTTSYSTGISVVICYVSLLLHFLAVFLLICIKHRTVEKRKMINVLIFMGISLVILIFQVTMPESLISSLFPTIAIIGIYISFEDPSLKRIVRINDEMVSSFATMVENRDNSTGGHIKRTREYVRIIMNELAKQQKYSKLMTRDYYTDVVNAAPMHDLGKISTPDRILQKPGKLTDEEYEIMKQHAAVGGDIAKEIFSDVDSTEYRNIMYEIARHHHEKWNGKGYPDGLKGEEIPLHARVMAIADVFDAVSAKRCYRDALPIETCFKIIEEGAGEDFDPELVAVFLSVREKVLRYYQNEK